MQDIAVLTNAILSGVVVGAIVGIALVMILRSQRSRRFRTRYDIPDIIGKWRCQWFDSSLVMDEPKVEDIVEVKRWTGDTEFVAQGFQPQFHLSYPLTGEVDPSRLVTLVYSAARYPYEPNRGVVCMELSRDGNMMEGQWFGRRYSGQLGGGKVIWIRMPESVTA